MDIVSRSRSRDKPNHAQGRGSSSNHTQRRSSSQGRHRDTQRRSTSRSRSRDTQRRGRSQDRHTQGISTFQDRSFSRRKTADTIKLLNKVCSYIGIELCLSLTQYGPDILKLFDEFQFFNNMESNYDIIPGEHSNGFIGRLKYRINQIEIHAILKSAYGSISDNIVYEYLVGQHINTFRNRLPCFVRTYALYYYNSHEFWQNIKKLKGRIVHAQVAKKLSLVKKIPNILDTDAYRYAILTENVPNARLLRTLLHDIPFLENHLIYCLYQIYFTLSVLHNEFTHYDLHPDNVMIIKLPQGTYMTHNYRISDSEVVVFHSRYVVKIIDFGRSYCNNVSDGIYQQVKEHIEINTIDTDEINRRFKSMGLRCMSPSFAEENRITSYKNNVSHDLRLLNEIHKVLHPSFSQSLFQHQNISPKLQLLLDILSKVKYGPGIVSTMWYNGTDEITQQTLDGSTIQNVMDAELCLRYAIMNEMNNDTVGRKIGDLHIDGINEMRFDP